MPEAKQGTTQRSPPHTRARINASSRGEQWTNTTKYEKENTGSKR